MAQTDRQTDRHTDGHGDSMTDPAQRAESVKTNNQAKLFNKYRLKITYLRSYQLISQTQVLHFQKALTPVHLQISNK